MEGVLRLGGRPSTEWEEGMSLIKVAVDEVVVSKAASGNSGGTEGVLPRILNQLVKMT